MIINHNPDFVLRCVTVSIFDISNRNCADDDIGIYLTLNESAYERNPVDG